MWVDRCVESTGGEQTRGRCALHCLGRVRGEEGGGAWCSLWGVMLMRMQDALDCASFMVQKYLPVQPAVPHADSSSL